MDTHPSRRWYALATVSAAQFLAVADAFIVNVAIPAIRADLHGGLATQEWVIDAYLLTLGSLILVGGSLGDIFGETRVFAIGVAAFAGASLRRRPRADRDRVNVATVTTNSREAQRRWEDGRR